MDKPDVERIAAACRRIIAEEVDSRLQALQEADNADGLFWMLGRVLTQLEKWDTDVAEKQERDARGRSDESVDQGADAGR